jgi:hypothetical protein
MAKVFFEEVRLQVERRKPKKAHFHYVTSIVVLTDFAGLEFAVHRHN